MSTVRRGVLLAMLLLPPLVETRAVAETVAQRCPEYVIHLAHARTLLERGHRDAALNALRDARSALNECLRASGKQPAVLYGETDRQIAGG